MKNGYDLQSWGQEIRGTVSILLTNNMMLFLGDYKEIQTVFKDCLVLRFKANCLIIASLGAISSAPSVISSAPSY